MKTSTTRCLQQQTILPTTDAMDAIDKFLAAQREMNAALNFADTRTVYGAKSRVCVSPASMLMLRAKMNEFSQMLTKVDWVSV